MRDLEATADELASLLGVSPEAIDVERGDVVLTNAQARRLLVLARKGKDST